MQQGAPRQNEAECDYSQTLISALCMAFNNQPPKIYVASQFRAIKDGRCEIDRPATFIRIDVAHLMHLVTGWKCFQRLTQTEVKVFYTFCVGLLVDSTTLTKFEEIFSLTCVVAVQKYNDSDINIKGQRTTKEARNKLENMIAHQNMNDRVRAMTEQGSIW